MGDPGMSRIPSNEDICHLGNQVWKGMDSLTIVDPNRLRVPFAGVCGNSAPTVRLPKRQSWMTVPSNTCNPIHDGSGPTSSGPTSSGPTSSGPTSSGWPDEVVEIPMQSRAVMPNLLNPTNLLSPLGLLGPSSPLNQSSLLGPSSLLNQSSSQHTEVTGKGEGYDVHGWVLAVGYSIFGLSLALGNLLAPQHTSKVCVAVSPIPFLCLLLQALACMERDRRDIKHGLRTLGPSGLMLSASALPSACVLWSVYLAIPLVLALSLSVFVCMRHRDTPASVCLAGVFLSLLMALPAPAEILGSLWGMTVAIFFVCSLCFLAGIGSGGMAFKIKIH